jgi:phenylpropionate dioxygenase-like ring-hydroxylating dioxygenase large terminal subunit
VARSGEDFAVHRTDTGEALPTRLRYGYLWTTLGEPVRDVLPIPEADEEDRRLVVCGAISVRSSAPRVVENFLDMAHFPFVHTDILGAEPHTEVRHYTTEIRRDIDEVWATNCQFFQPQAALSAKEGIMTQYQYRVADPFAVLLYKTCPNAANRWDVICLFVQPVDPELCRAHPVMFLIDEVSTVTELVAFQQVIFLQDRIILENQRPLLLPLEPRSEIPTRADASSVAYRRWLKEKGIVYGTTAQAA